MVCKQVIDGDMINDIFDHSYFQSMFYQQEAEKETIRFGFDGTHYCLHHDQFNNMLVQVHGEKLLVMLNPLEEDLLYWETNPNHMHYTQSPVWPRDPDYEAYPLFKQAKGLQHLLKGGDVVYIPPFWWHYLEATDPALDTDAVPYWMSFNRFMNSYDKASGNRTFPCRRECLKTNQRKGKHHSVEL